MRQYGGIDAALEKEVKLLLSLPSIGFYVGIAQVCIGGVLYIIGVLLTIFKKWGGRELKKGQYGSHEENQRSL